MLNNNDGTLKKVKAILLVVIGLLLWVTFQSMTGIPLKM